MHNSTSLALAILTTLSVVHGATHLHQQAPLKDIEVMTSELVITDALPSHRNIQIFTSLIRDNDMVSKLLSSSSSQNYTVLAPANSAMTSLPHKPWEDPEQYKEFGADAYEGANGQNRAQENIQKFVEAHIVPKAPWHENEKVPTLHAGQSDKQNRKAVWWESDGSGGRVIAPDGIKVESLAAQVSNGEIWILDRTLKP